MICHRCHGLMVVEQTRDAYADSGDICLDSYRCLQCGEVVDAMILSNRQQVADRLSSRKSTQPRLPRLMTA